MNADGTVRGSTKIASGLNGGPNLLPDDAFGTSVAGLGDLDGDGVPELAVGAVGDDTGGNNRGGNLYSLPARGWFGQEQRRNSPRIEQWANLVDNRLSVRR